MIIATNSVKAALKRMNKQNLKSSAVVQHETTTSGPGGSTVKTWVNRLTDPLPCRVSTPTAQDQERLTAAQIEAAKTAVVTFEAGADVRLKDRFIVTMEDGRIVTMYPIGKAIRDAEVMRKVICEWRGDEDE